MTREHVFAGELMAVRTGSVDPAKFPDETFELHSIPAFDAGKPEIVTGSQIGSSKQNVQPNDVMISKIVPHIRRAAIVGSTSGLRQIASGEWIVFRSERFHPNYLRHLLISDRFNSQFMSTVSGVGGSLLRARPAEVSKIRIPLPPLPEQRRIAAILDKADALRAKRREAIAKLEQLLQSVFLEMFGDPIANPKGWPLKAMLSLTIGKNGVKAGPFGSALKKEFYTSSGFRVYGQEQVIGGSLEIGDYYVDAERFAALSSCAVQTDDLLISLVGTFGRILIVPETFEPGIINPRLLKISPNTALVLPEFLQQYFLAKSTQKYLSSLSHGGTMGILNAGLIKHLSVAVPPLTLQAKFIAQKSAIARLTSDALSSQSKLEALFSGIQSTAFALTA